MDTTYTVELTESQYAALLEDVYKRQKWCGEAS